LSSTEYLLPMLPASLEIMLQELGPWRVLLATHDNEAGVHVAMIDFQNVHSGTGEFTELVSVEVNSRRLYENSLEASSMVMSFW